MKKIIYTAIIVLAAGNSLHAQSFLDKVKSKVNKAVESKEPEKPTASTSSSDPKYTDPSKYGTVIYTFSSSAMNQHMGGSEGGYDLWFSSVKVVNNQLSLKINDYDKALGNYTNGQFQKTEGTADVNSQNNIPNGNEDELKSKDFSQTDMMNAMLKKGPSIAGPRLPGKITLAYTFNGKLLGDFMSGFLAHNPDSTAVSIIGMQYAAGAIKYVLATSNGQKVDLPVKIQGNPLISPDGKTGGAVVPLLTGAGTEIYLTNGSKVTTGVYNANFGIWLHNSGAVYYVNGDKELMKNGQSFITTTYPISPKTLFIASDDNTVCWPGDHGLCFSDGTIFANAECPHRVTINGKEVIVFLDIDIPTGKLYLCQHDL